MTPALTEKGWLFCKGGVFSDMSFYMGTSRQEGEKEHERSKCAGRTASGK